MMLLLEYDVPAGQHLPSGQYTVFGRNFNVSIGLCPIFLLRFTLISQGILTGVCCCADPKIRERNGTSTDMFLCAQVR